MREEFEEEFDDGIMVFEELQGRGPVTESGLAQAAAGAPGHPLGRAGICPRQRLVAEACLRCQEDQEEQEGDLASDDTDSDHDMVSEVTM